MNPLTESRWRKRKGIEPSDRPHKGRPNGFEVRGSHQAPCASVRSDSSTGSTAHPPGYKMQDARCEIPHPPGTGNKEQGATHTRPDARYRLPDAGSRSHLNSISSPSPSPLPLPKTKTVPHPTVAGRLSLDRPPARASRPSGPGFWGRVGGLCLRAPSPRCPARGSHR